jgi:hypothetical protein
MRRLLVLGILALCGCSGESGTPLPLDQLPSGHLKIAEDKIAQEKLPKVKFESASKLKDGTYEIRGRDASGKRREVEIHPDGKVNLD